MPTASVPLGFLAAGAGLSCHLASPAAAVRYFRRRLELLHGFLLASAAFLIAGIALGATAALADWIRVTGRAWSPPRSPLSSAGWGLAVGGHADRIVPFIGSTALRARGVS